MASTIFCRFVATGPAGDLTRLWKAAALPARAVPALSAALARASRPLPRDCTPEDVVRQLHATELLRDERRFFDFAALAPGYRFPGGPEHRHSRVADIASRLGSRTSLAFELQVDARMPTGFWRAFAQAWPKVSFATSWVCETGSRVGYAVRCHGLGDGLGDGPAQEREVADARRFTALRRERDRAFAPLLEALRIGRPYRFLASEPTPTSRRLALAAGIDMANVIHVASRAELATVARSLAGEILPASSLPPSRRTIPT
jgi:hypothetical protein